MASKVGDRRFSRCEFCVVRTHEFQNPDKGKDVVSWTDGSRGEGVAGGASAIAGAPSRIGNQGFIKGAILDNEKADFPIGKSPTGTEKR